MRQLLEFTQAVISPVNCRADSRQFEGASFIASSHLLAEYEA